jgi:hypothetical protein
MDHHGRKEGSEEPTKTDALKPCPPSYLVIGILRLLVQSKPDLIAVAAKHYISRKPRIRIHTYIRPFALSVPGTTNTKPISTSATPRTMRAIPSVVMVAP